MNVFFRNDKLTSSDDELFCPALPNISSSFHACFPGPSQNEDVSIMVDEALANFWGSSFNNDWSGNRDAAFASIPGFDSIQTWEKKSAQNPRFACSLPWQSARMTVTTAAINALHSDDQDKNTFLSLDAHVQRLGETIGQGIQESCLELLPQWHIPDATLAIANEKWTHMVGLAGKHAAESFSRGFASACASDETEKAVCDMIQEFATKTVSKLEYLSISLSDNIIHELLKEEG